MIGFWSYTVILTYLSLTSAFVGITLSVLFAEGDTVTNIMIPLACLLIAGFCDLFDGKVARSKKNRTDDEKAFGMQIDSLCDLVAFTVFPATLGFCIGGNHILAAFAGACLILCGVIRLGYFNVIEMKRQNDPNNTDTGYTGLPVTPTALIVPALFLFKDFFGDYFPTFFHICLIIIAILFVSKIKIKKPGTKGMFIQVIIGSIIITLIFRNWYILIVALPFIAFSAYMMISDQKKKKSES